MLTIHFLDSLSGRTSSSFSYRLDVDSVYFALSNYIFTLLGIVLLNIKKGLWRLEDGLQNKVRESEERVVRNWRMF